jgi:hypothetical protein
MGGGVMAFTRFAPRRLRPVSPYEQLSKYGIGVVERRQYDKRPCSTVVQDWPAWVISRHRGNSDRCPLSSRIVDIEIHLLVAGRRLDLWGTKMERYDDVKTHAEKAVIGYVVGAAVRASANGSPARGSV